MSLPKSCCIVIWSTPHSGRADPPQAEELDAGAFAAHEPHTFASGYCRDALFGADDVDSIVINESVELAKKYGSDGDYQFINGVLGSVSRAGKASFEAQATEC